ncbi:hypothetical protein [Beihai picorna-like virus 45]|uniref:hypothetical protein n=1 Tax=Beihai picorna-like virus 45 TaxID=1922589 RepID=UPI0009096D44|nr:hypothetical protein [Beihai picorna-like virus 45]APG78916.1 hypothetical protein [Beihai picorna-like virus 45]
MKFPSLFRAPKICCSNDAVEEVATGAVSAPKHVHVILSVGHRSYVVKATYGYELYNHVYENAYDILPSWVLNGHRFYFEHRGRPIRPTLPLTTHDVHDGDTIQVVWALSVGGSKSDRALRREYGDKKWRSAKRAEEVAAGMTEYLESAPTSDFEREVRHRIIDRVMQPQGGISSLVGVPDADYIINLLEGIALMGYQMSRANGKMDMLAAVMAFAKGQATGPLLNSERVNMLTSFLEKVFEETASDISVAFGSETEVPMQGGVGDALKSLRGLVDHYETVRDSKVMQKMHRFLMYALSLSLFEKVGITFDNFKYTTLEAEAIKRKFTAGPDFIHCLVDTLLFIAERGHQCMITGEVSAIFHSAGAYEDWYNRSSVIVRQSKLLSNPEPHGINIPKWIADLMELIEKGKAIGRHMATMDGLQKRVFLNMQASLEMAHSDYLTKRAAGADRAAPFGVLVFGGSGIAKSAFTKALFYHFGKLTENPIEDEFRYVRNSNDEFWSGFQSYQWCVQLDDIAYLKPGTGQPDPTVLEMLQVVNSVPFVPNQAELENKGRTPMRAQLVVATSNEKTLNAFHYFQCPLAIQRRLPYVITLEVKQEYARDGVFLDADLAPHVAEGEYPDFWVITVDRVVPEGANTAKWETVGKFSDIYQFFDWFSAAALKFREQQQKVNTSDKAMQKMVLCKKCYRPQGRGVCETCFFGVEEQDAIPTQGLVSWFIGNWLTSSEFRTGFEYAVTAFSSCYAFLFARYVELFRYCMKGEGGAAYNRFVTLMYLTLSKAFGLEERAMMCFQFLCIDSVADFFARRVYRMSLGEQTLVLRSAGHAVNNKIGFFKLFATVATAITAIYWCIKGFNLFERKTGETINLVASKTGAYIVRNGLVPKERRHIYDECQRQQAAGETAWQSWTNEDIEWMARTGQLLPNKQGGISSTIGRAPENKNEDQNVWYKDDFQCTSFDLPQSGQSMANFDNDRLLSVFERNLISFVAVNNGCRRTMKAVCLGGQFYMTNNHAFNDTGSIKVEVTCAPVTEGITQNMQFLLTQAEIFRIPEKDLAFFQIRALPPRKDITKFFAKEDMSGVSNGFYMQRNEQGEIVEIEVFNCFKRQQAIATLGMMTCWMGTAERPTQEGDCGSLLLLRKRSGIFLAGIHVGGVLCDVAALPVTMAEITSAKNALQPYEIQSGAPMISSESAKRNFEHHLHPRSPFRFLQDGVATVYGSFAGFRTGGRSKVCKTLTHDLALAEGYEVKTAAPVMHGWAPWYNAAAETTNPVTDIDLGLLDKVKGEFIDEILERLDPKMLKEELFVYDDLTAINGANGVRFVDKMNRATSMGCPWKKTKKDFLEKLPPTESCADPVTFTPEVMNRVQIIIQTYLLGIMAMPIFSGSLKDEALKLKKVLAKLTRVFCASPADWNIVVRKYYLSFVRLMQLNRFIFEASIGCVAQSQEWEDIREFLTRFGCDRLVAGDYKAFDKRMPPSVILAAFDIIIAICKKSGNYTEDDIKVMVGIAFDTAFPLVDFNGDLVQFCGSNPSGHPLTVVINSLVNSLYIRYAYATLNPKERSARDFKKNVALQTYGDDNVFGVKQGCEWFNHTSVAGALADIGITYTMADKDAESVPYIHIDEVSFLKRVWRFDEDLQHYVCPLDEDSIAKMLTLHIPSKEDPVQKQTVDVLSTVTREYFWYGRETFEKKRAMCIRFATELGLMDIWVQQSTFPTWEQLAEQYAQSSARRLHFKW